MDIKTLQQWPAVSHTNDDVLLDIRARMPVAGQLLGNRADVGACEIRLPWFYIPAGAALVVWAEGGRVHTALTEAGGERP